MSIDAMRWAWSAPVRSSAQRLVLLCLADRAGEEHTCWPSMARVERDTCLNLKTVKSVIHELAELGLIRDTGERKGATQRVRVFQLIGVFGREETNPKTESFQKRNDSKNGFLNEPKNGFLNEPNFGSQNLSMNLSMNQESTRAKKSERKKPKTAMPDGFGVSDRVKEWASQKGFDRLSDHLEVFVSKCCANGYVYADWDQAFMNAVREDWAHLRDTPSKTAYERDTATSGTRMTDSPPPTRSNAIAQFSGLLAIAFKKAKTAHPNLTQADVIRMAKERNVDELVVLNELAGVGV